MLEDLNEEYKFCEIDLNIHDQVTTSKILSFVRLVGDM